MGQIWKNKVTPAILNDMHQETMVGHLGIQVTEIGENYIKMSMPVDYRTIQPMGLLHGGASMVMAETAGSIASFLCTDNVKTHVPVGVEINASHLKSATKGNVYSTTTPLKIGNRLHSWNTDIHDGEGNLICTSRLTVMIIPSRK